MTNIEAITDAMRVAMRCDENVIVLGEGDNARAQSERQRSDDHHSSIHMLPPFVSSNAAGGPRSHLGAPRPRR